MIWLIIQKLSQHTQILGWTSTMLTIIFFSGITIMTLGIVGEYIGRMFLTIGKYPQFVVRDVYRGKKEKEEEE